MNILFVAHGYPRKGQPAKGFPNYLYRVSLALIQLGHKPMILAAGDWDSYRMEEGIEIWTVRVPPHDGYDVNVLQYVLNALHKGYILNKQIKHMTKEMNVDVIQFTSLHGIAALYTGKTPAVLRLSSYAKTYFSTFQTYSKMLVRTMSMFERMSAKRCNVVIAPCKNTAVAFEKDIHRNVKVIETPFINDVQKYDYQYFDTQLRGKKYVLFFGTLYAEKGIVIISEILEKFLTNNPDYYFVFIGDVCSINGENSAKLLRKKAGKCVEQIIISNAMPHKMLYPVIMHADFVVLPSLMDNLPNACIEAMYFERVVIGTDGASFEQLITHGKNGLLCRIGDSNDLLEKMQSAAFMSAEQKEEMGKLAGKRIERLKPEYAVRKLVRLYEYVLENVLAH